MSSWRTEYKKWKFEKQFDRIRSEAKPTTSKSGSCAQTLELTSHFSAGFIFLSRYWWQKAPGFWIPPIWRQPIVMRGFLTQEWETNERGNFFPYHQQPRRICSWRADLQFDKNSTVRTLFLVDSNERWFICSGTKDHSRIIVYMNKNSYNTIDSNR